MKMWIFDCPIATTVILVLKCADLMCVFWRSAVLEACTPRRCIAYECLAGKQACAEARDRDSVESSGINDCAEKSTPAARFAHIAHFGIAVLPLR